jgi:undecaprenyl-diphosphatase
MPSSSWRSISALDAALCAHINRISRFWPACALFRVVSRLGDGVAWYALMAALVLWDGAQAWPVVLRMATAGVCGIAVYRALKMRTSRPRPFQVVPDVTAAALPLDEFSFPSGHTLHAVAFTLIATTSYPDLSLLLFPFTALIATSRLVLGLHYPSDVLAGGVIGGVIASALLAI